MFEKFHEFKTRVENTTIKTIKTLWSDNGVEYVSKELIDLCKDVGIKREMIVPYYPQQNGTVEIKNRNIMEATKAMLHDHGLLLFL